MMMMMMMMMFKLIVFPKDLSPDHSQQDSHSQQAKRVEHHFFLLPSFQRGVQHLRCEDFAALLGISLISRY